MSDRVTRIENTRLYQSGRWFSAHEMAQTLGEKPKAVRQTLVHMHNKGAVWRDVERAMYARPQAEKHFIHRRRLADTSHLVEEETDVG